jgi:DnaJ-domain-containing protein 1
MGRRRRSSFGFRKSYRLGGGFRLNASKSGLGASWGVKGFRISVGPKGKYLNMGSNGFYYRQKINSSPSSDYQHKPENMNNSHKGSRNWFAIVMGGVVIFGILSLIDYVLAVIATVIFLYVVIKNGSSSNLATENTSYDSSPAHKNRGFVYEQTEDLNRKIVLLRDIMTVTNQSEFLWLVSSVEANYNWKAAAAYSVSRAVCKLKVLEGKEYKSNVQLFYFDTTFASDRIILQPYSLVREYKYGLDPILEIPYKDFSISFNTTRFLETGNIPKDAATLGETWLYINKNGGPDRRYKDNRVVPVMEYGVVGLTQNTYTSDKKPFNLGLYFSNIAIAKQVYVAFKQLADQIIEETENKYDRSESNNSKSQDESSTKIEEAYKILGITSQANEDEITTAYRELAKKYHPDKVNHLASEFRELADRKMKEINAAYSLIHQNLL